MHFIYKQDYYKDKQKETYDLFIEYRVHIMEDLYRNVLVEGWRQNLYATAYEKNLNQYVKIPSIKEKLIVTIKLKTGQHS